MKRLIPALAACAVLITSSIPVAATQVNTSLARIKGSVGYRADAVSPMQPIVTSLVLPDTAFAVTQAKSAGIITMPDSSEITLGEATKVQVGAFKTGEAGPGSTIRIDHGALEFSIKHPSGGKSNFQFITDTTEIAVRGTDGYVASGPNEDVVAVTSASSTNDVTVKTGGKTYHVAAGKSLHIKKHRGRVVGTSYTAGASHPAFKQFASLHKPSFAKAGAAAVAGVAAGAALHHAQAAARKKKKHH